MKREAANLIILVDQFEEFFTNPENYQHGVPSKEANLVLNLFWKPPALHWKKTCPSMLYSPCGRIISGNVPLFAGYRNTWAFPSFLCPD